jgi:hypothetical protein
VFLLICVGFGLYCFMVIEFCLSVVQEVCGLPGGF